MHSDPIVDSEALRAARMRAGLTQHELARLVGVAGGERISRWELGASTPRPEILHRLAAVLEVGPGDLLIPIEGEPDLRRLRLLAGISSRDLAARANLSAPTYIRWEAGRFNRLPPRGSLEALARQLRVGLAEVTAAVAASRGDAE